MPRPNRLIPFETGRKAQTHVTIDVNTGCWNSKFAEQSNGYSSVSWREDGKTYAAPAHRASYAFTYGPIPDGLVVDHMCFNRRCVNPDHLRLLTLAQNNMRRKEIGHDFPLDQCSRGHSLDMQVMQKGGKWAGKRTRCAGCQKERNDAMSARLKAERAAKREQACTDVAP